MLEPWLHFSLSISSSSLSYHHSPYGHGCKRYHQVELASRGEGNLVKLAVPIVPKIDDYEFTSRSLSRVEICRDRLDQR